MNNNLEVRKTKLDTHSMSIDIAWEEFEGIHPKGARPEWLEKYIRIRGNKNQNKNWVIRIILMLKVQLESNQRWEWIKDTPMIVEVDPITGKESVIISGGPASDIEAIFEVEVDLAKGLTTILIDTDLSILDQTKYQVHSR